MAYIKLGESENEHTKVYSRIYNENLERSGISINVKQDDGGVRFFFVMLLLHLKKTFTMADAVATG